MAPPTIGECRIVSNVTLRTSDAQMATARQVIEEVYRLPLKDLTHLATHSNALYKADLADGRRLVLRMGEPTANTRTNIDIEVAWLMDLARDDQLNLAVPVPAADGRLVVDVVAPEASWVCVLFTWVPGEALGEGAGTSGYRAMGRLSGRLHRHGDWRPPDPTLLRRWDQTFYYPEEFEQVVLADPGYDHLFHAVRSELNEAVAVTDHFLEHQWSQFTPMVVHGDLHEWNVHLNLGRAWGIDFEDVMLALPAQDVSVSLYRARGRPDIERLISAFRGGYEEERRWPVGDRTELDGYWAARQVMLMNHAAQTLRREEALEYFETVMPWLRSFLDRFG
ncbi:hypothetical protein BH23ACT5_BH23ACT5_05250 [soil metagenome]